MEQHTKLTFEHLKAFDSTEGYWSTEACLDIAEDILKITQAKSMLEIGFNIGYSAAVWIEKGIKRLSIIDINNHKDTVPAINATIATYKDVNIEWWLGDSTSEDAFLVDIEPVDIAFIDGEHSYIACLSDSYLSILNGAKWLVYDDVIEYHENGINDVIKRLEMIGMITVIKSYKMSWTEQGNVVLAKVNYVNV